MIANLVKFSLAVMLAGSIARAQTITITARGVRNLDNVAPGNDGAELRIGGLSGIVWRLGDEFLSIQDNGGRIVRFGITFRNDASIDSIKCLGTITLSDARDFEGIAMAPGNPDRVFLSEEQTPAVHEYSLSSGELVRTLQTPKAFAGGATRSNSGFEALAANDREIWTANEEALQTDGAQSDDKTGCAVRLLRYAIADDGIAPAQQFVYLTDPIHGAAKDAQRGLSRSGVVDLLLLPDGRLLVLERSYATTGPIPDFRNAIYEIDFAGATDVSSAQFESGLKGHRFNPVTKRLLWSLRGPTIGNLEGIALGRQLSPNTWVAVGVVDNNNHKLLTNRAAAFEIKIERRK